MKRSPVRLPDGIFTLCCEIIALAVVSYGLWMLLPALGVIAAGLSLFAVGWMIKE